MTSSDFVLPPERIFEWAETACRGQSLVYAYSHNGAAHGRGMSAALALWEQAGMVALVQRREKVGISYIMQRNGRDGDLRALRRRFAVPPARRPADRHNPEERRSPHKQGVWA